MSFADLRRRLDRIEGNRVTGAPTGILADRPMPDEEAADALANWQTWIASGRASLTNGVLWILAPKLTTEEWATRYVTAD